MISSDHFRLYFVGGINEKPHDKTANSDGVKLRLLLKTLTPLLAIQEVNSSSLLSFLIARSAMLLLGLRSLPTLLRLLSTLETRAWGMVGSHKILDTLVAVNVLAVFCFFADEVRPASVRMGAGRFTADDAV